MPARTRSPRHLSAFGTALLYVHRVSCRREFVFSFKRHTRLLALSPEPEALAKYRPHGMRWKEHVRKERAYSYATLTIASSVFHGRCCPTRCILPERDWQRPSFWRTLVFVQRWRCHDGTRMLVSEMTDSHLAKSIAMIHRGHDAMGNVVRHRTRRLLPALLVERDIRRIRRGE